ncbi:hypothetical protein YB2330_002813 [Saitoella coloradoensis]
MSKSFFTFPRSSKAPVDVDEDYDGFDGFDGHSGAPDVGVYDGLARKIVYPAGVDYEGKPLVVMAACNFPNPKDFDYDFLLQQVLAALDLYIDESDYSVVLLAGGGQHRMSWPWMLKSYGSLGRKYRKNIKSLYILHSTWWVRVLFDLTNTITSPKFAKKVKHVPTLSELATLVPLNQIDIPPEVYKHNSKYEAHVEVPAQDQGAMFGLRLEDVMGHEGENGLPRVVRDVINYLRAEGLNVEGIFRRSPSSAVLKQVKSAYDRDQNISLSDYDPFLAASLLKLYLRSLPEPIIPADLYPALKKVEPITDYSELVYFIRHTLLPNLGTPAVVLLSEICSLLHDVSLHSSVNLMHASNLAICISPCLLRHPTNPMLDATMSNPQSGGVGKLIVACIERTHEIFDLEGSEMAQPKADSAFSISSTCQPSPTSPPPTASTYPTSTNTTATSSSTSTARRAGIAPSPSKYSTISSPRSRSVSAIHPRTRAEDLFVPKSGSGTRASTEHKLPQPYQSVNRAGGKGVVGELKRVFEERSKVVEAQAQADRDKGKTVIRRSFT